MQSLHQALDRSSDARRIVKEILVQLTRGKATANLIGEVIGVPRGTVARWLILLERYSWVEGHKLRNPQIKLWAITQAGRQALENVKLGGRHDA